MTKIIGFSGKKQAGKNTCANLMVGIELTSAGICHQIEVKEDGLHVSDIFGNPDGQGIFDVNRNSDDMRNFLEEYLDPYIRLYSFADLLKKSICIDILGLSYDQCYGTDEQKNSETHLRWENMPASDKVGNMTARDVMQYIGTDIFRKMYPTVWSEGTIRRIQKDGSFVAVITDCRFPDEVEAIQNAHRQPVTDLLYEGAAL